MKHLAKIIVVVLLAPLLLTEPISDHSHSSSSRSTTGSAPAVLWRYPKDIKTRDLYFGPGGREHMPQGKLTFLREDMNGTQPKFFVRDSNGVLWGAKMGKEARVETAATRLLWAAGYFADEEYYLPDLTLPTSLHLSRGQEFANKGRAAVRLKRHNPGTQHVGFWKWDHNPFTGSRALNGLKVMMELMNNTDLKTDHMIIYDVGGKEQRYLVKDLGASFGRAGSGYFERASSKGVLRDFVRFNLIRHVDGDFVDFWYFKHVPRKDAKWLGELIGQLSYRQIADAFRAGGFSQQEVDGFTRKLREKIAELQAL